MISVCVEEYLFKVKDCVMYEIIIISTNSPSHNGMTGDAAKINMGIWVSFIAIVNFASMFGWTLITADPRIRLFDCTVMLMYILNYFL